MYDINNQRIIPKPRTTAYNPKTYSKRADKYLDLNNDGDNLPPNPLIDIEPREKIGGCTFGILSVVFLGISLYFLIESNWNRRAVEIDDYLKNVLEWNEYFGKEFSNSEIEVVPVKALNASNFNNSLILPLTKFEQETYSEV